MLFLTIYNDVYTCFCYKYQKKKNEEVLNVFSARSLCEKPIYFMCKYITLTGYGFSGVDQITIESQYVDFIQQCLLQH